MISPYLGHGTSDTVIHLEERALKERKMSDRMSDSIANFVGSIPFVIIHVTLCMLVSLEGVLLSTFVLIRQNRMSQRADHRSHLDLQINLLAEKEITKVLQLERMICDRLGIEEAVSDPEVVELSEITAVDNLAETLDERMPADV